MKMSDCTICGETGVMSDPDRGDIVCRCMTDEIEPTDLERFDYMVLELGSEGCNIEIFDDAKDEIIHLRAYVEKLSEHFDTGAEKFQEVIARIEELEGVWRCEHCGSDKMYSGPPDCPDCGAPNCCQTCCKITTLELRRDEIIKAVKNLKDSLSYQGHAASAEQVLSRVLLLLEKKDD